MRHLITRMLFDRLPVSGQENVWMKNKTGTRRPLKIPSNLNYSMTHDLIILGDKHPSSVTAAWKPKSFSSHIFFPSCGSHYFLHFLLLIPWRVIMQVWSTGISWVEEKFYEKWNCHGKLHNTLFPSTLKLSGWVKDFSPSAVKNQEENQVLRGSFLLPMPVFGAALAPSVQVAAQVSLHCGCLCASVSELTPQQSHLCFTSVCKSQPRSMVRPQSKRKFLKVQSWDKVTSWSVSRESINKDSVTVPFIQGVNHQHKNNLLLKQID